MTDETSRIVAWLRGQRNQRMARADEYGDRDHVSGIALEWAANAIERGVHIKETSDGRS